MSHDSTDHFDTTEILPDRIGRYVVRSRIGSGGFGSVFLATDERLQRDVAVKVPHSHLLNGKHRGREYLEEARMVANLDHPHIVPVFDVGSSPEFVCFIVSKFISGTNLANLLRRRRPDIRQSVQWVERIADALQHAHKRGLVHRDVKPSNIVIDEQGKPYITDFGLALPERDVGRGPQYAGTPAYMSPEQARGEGHRVDGRSDVFSLGAVLYELLSGRRAFQGESKSDLLEQVEHVDARPLRQLDEKLPKELDRICQKAMAKRANERYWTAHDFAADLIAFLDQHDVSATSPGEVPSTSTVMDSETPEQATSVHTAGSTEATAPAPLTPVNDPVIVPKGLRAFDGHDADFFLELIPGPRDRAGLPESLRFWKTRIESRDPDEAFSVGLMYGPSGSGKSSFIQAGLLPNLAKHVVPLIVECSEEQTEQRLRQSLQKACPTLEIDWTLDEAIAAIRRGSGLLAGEKLLIVFDQFERWLHGRNKEQTDRLIRALRQCDGEHVQALLLVRSDFWMAVTRLSLDLEVDLIQGKNAASIDLFPPMHAERVLESFGRSFGALPAQGALTSEQRAFVQQSVEGLLRDGKVICVRLAVYAEMVKNKVWSSGSLKSIGGTEGVGVSFLDDSFGEQASPRIRFHGQSARRILSALLPDQGTDISTRLLSQTELKKIARCGTEKEFQDVMSILDNEMRLISPIDQLALASGEIEDSHEEVDPSQRYYRLTHDYLIDALRRWLNRKQLETKSGRARLLLADRASLWKHHPETRFLPSLSEYTRIRLHTQSEDWDAAESSMMSAAARRHMTLAAVFTMLVALLGFGSFKARNWIVAEQDRIREERLEEQYSAEASRLVDSLLNAETSRVPEIVAGLGFYEKWAGPRLLSEYQNQPDGSTEKLHVAMAMAATENEQLDYLTQQLPRVSAERFLAVSSTIVPNSGIGEGQKHREIPDYLLDLVRNEEVDPRLRLQAACVVAQFDATHRMWKDASECQRIANELTRLFPSELAPLREALSPVSDALIVPLESIFDDASLPDQQRLFATESLVAYLRNDVDRLMALLLRSEAQYFPLLFQAVLPAREKAKQIAQAELRVDVDEIDTPSAADALARRQANAAIVLYRLGDQLALFDILDHHENAQLHSFAVHWAANRRADPSSLKERFLASDNLSTQFALMLTLGTFGYDHWSLPDRQAIAARTETLCRNSSDAALQSAGRWLLLQLNEKELATELETAYRESGLPEGVPEWTPVSELLAAGMRTAVNSAEFSNWLDEILVGGGEVPEKTYFVELESLDQLKLGEDAPVAVVPGPFGNSLEFAGGSFPIGGNELAIDKAVTLSCWMRTDNRNGYGALVSRMDPAANLRGFDLWMEEGYLAGHIKNAYIGDEDPDNHWIKAVSQRRIDDGRWHCVAMTYDGSGQGSGLKLFVDGQRVETNLLADSMVGSFGNDVPLFVGGRPDNYFFQGTVSRVGLWDSQLEEHEISSLWIRDLQVVTEKPRGSWSDSQVTFLTGLYGIENPEYSTEWTEGARAHFRALAEHARNWYYTPTGDRMLRVKAGRFLMGAPPQDPYYSEFDLQHQRVIDRVYALADRETTVSQWGEFLERGGHSHDLMVRFADIGNRAPQSPITGVSWFEAAEYCNWLSARAGIPEAQWCYVPNAEGKYAEGMSVRPEFWNLHGFRLPTQAEWEFACRAGTTTSRNYGLADDLLKHYAWYMDSSSNSPQPVATLKPNYWGFFDMHGNAQEWCFDLHSRYPYDGESMDDRPTVQDAMTTAPRSIRSGAYYDLPQYVTTASRYSYDPSSTQATGIRIAQTLIGETD